MAMNDPNAIPWDERPVVVVLGACVTDLMAYTDRFPQPGETVVGNSFLIDFGGKGSNVAGMCTRLGLHTALLAKLGRDSFGDAFQTFLKTSRICAEYLKYDDNLPSAASLITVQTNGENHVLYTPGAQVALTPDHIQEAEPAFKSAKVFLSVFETSMANLQRGLEIAKKHHLTTYVNAAPLVKEALPSSALPLIDYLCINDTEGSSLCCGLMNVPLKSLTSQEIADYLIEHGIPHVIITMGEKGAAFATKDCPTLELVPVTATVNVVDTTGAGDAFNGGFVYQLVKNSCLPLREKVRKAVGIASLTVERKGTQASYPERCNIPADYL